ncbi:MAG: hypothetical protein HEQ23_01770 [Tepidisphaera sp.]
MRAMKAALVAAAGLSALVTTAANGDVRVLVLGDASEPSWQADVISKIQATGRVDGVIDSFNNDGGGVPTLAQLKSYDVVLVWTDNGLDDGVALGNVLADYVDAGGNVIEMAFGLYDFPGIGIQGRWKTGGYAAMTAPSQLGFSTQGIGTRQVPSHPILEGVGAFSGGTSSFRLTATVTPGSYLIASWNDAANTPLVATRHVNAGKVAGLNFFPASSDARGDFWTAGTGGDILIANAINFVANNSVDALIIGAANPTWVEEVKDRLLESGRVGGRIDIVNGAATTPTVGDLRSYDTVLVFSDAPFANFIALGNNLADYVDSGGGVIVSTFATADSPGFHPGGRFESDGYNPFSLGTTTTSPVTLGTRFIAEHPLLKNIGSFDGGTSSYRSQAAFRPGSVPIARWSDGLPLVAAMPGRKGRIAGLNFYPPSSVSRSDFWNRGTDGSALIANAMNWTARNDNDVLILGDNAVGNAFGDITSKLRPELDGTIDTFDITTGTPGIARLRKYDSVMVYLSVFPAESDVLGDRLAEFVDGGGGVVDMFGTTLSGFAIGGRFNSQGYSGLLVGGNAQPGTLTLGARLQPLHPVLESVGEVNIGGLGAHNAGGVRPGSLRIADLSNGAPFIVERATGTGRVLTLNFFPVSNDVFPGLWLPSTDGAKLMANALDHVARSDIEVLSLATQAVGSTLEADVRKKIERTSRIRSKLDAFDNQAGNPPRGLLLAYDAVLAWSNFGQPDGVDLGNKLADYADAGGGVVTLAGLHSGTTFGATGRWINRPYGAAAFGAGVFRELGVGIGTRHFPAHPALVGVNSLNLGDGIHDFATTSSIGVRIADLSNGRPLVAEAKASGARQTIALNMFPASTDGIVSGWDATTQGGLLMANSLTYVSKERPCRADFNGDAFLDFFDYSDYVDCFETGTCPPGRTADFNGDGFVDFFDYADYVTAFEQGC